MIRLQWTNTLKQCSWAEDIFECEHSTTEASPERVHQGVPELP